MTLTLITSCTLVTTREVSQSASAACARASSGTSRCGAGGEGQGHAHEDQGAERPEHPVIGGPPPDAEAGAVGAAKGMGLGHAVTHDRPALAR